MSVPSLLIPVLAVVSVPNDPPVLRFEDMYARQSWTTRMDAVRWAFDGEHVVVGRGDDEEWRTVPDWELAEPSERPARERAAGDLTQRGSKLLYRPRDGEDVLLHESETELRVPALSPDLQWASFVENGDLHLVSTAGGEIRTLAGREGSNILEGLLDWVYQEEVYGRYDFQGHWWSPDSRHIAFLELDQSDVQSFPITRFDVPGVLESERGVELEVMDYPKAGDPNPVTRLGIADVESGELRFLDLSNFDEDLLVVRVGWSPSGHLEFVVQNRIQSTAALCTADPETGEVVELIAETSESWVERPEPPRWLSDGTFLWLTARSGYQHIEHRAADGALLREVTSGEWQVRSVIDVDEERGRLWFEGTRDGALGANVYYVDIADGEPVRLTPGRGTHQASFSADRRWVIDRVSSLDAPSSVRLVDGETGRVVRELGAEEVLEERPLRRARLMSITARDGYPLDATVILPERGVAGERPPIFLDTYSGPNAPSVRDRWRVSTWHQFLAQQGVLVLQVNVRTASGRGHAHTSMCYRQLGTWELQDLEDAVAHVVDEFGADPERVAISGWSYGGFMAAYALTHSDDFALGFAGAGVHDWQLYDTIYTERYMSTPQLNPDGYRDSSVILAAENLSGHLVLQHGTIDDNVHLQNTMLLVDALQKAGQDSFELMLYPGARHGVASPHRMRMVWRVLRERFGLEDPPAESD
ncbi:MAG: S9 family peptidase [Planctomycetota bacterium]|jgi:dipeptidyl-peptidase-4